MCACGLRSRINRNKALLVEARRFELRELRLVERQRRNDDRRVGLLLTRRQGTPEITKTGLQPLELGDLLLRGEILRERRLWNHTDLSSAPVTTTDAFHSVAADSGVEARGAATTSVQRIIPIIVPSVPRRAVFFAAVATLIGAGLLPAGPARRTPAEPSALEAPLTNEDIVRLTEAGLNPDLIVMKIRQAPSETLDVSADALVALHDQKVSDGVIAAIFERVATRASPPAATKESAAPPPPARESPAMPRNHEPETVSRSRARSWRCRAD